MKTNFMKSTGMLIANMTLVSGIAVAQVSSGAGTSGAMSGETVSPSTGSTSPNSSAPMAGQGSNANPNMGDGSNSQPSNQSAAEGQLNSDLAADRPNRVKLDSDDVAGRSAPVRSETEVSNLDSAEQLDDYAQSQAPENDGGNSGGSAELESAADTAMTGAEERMNAAQGGAQSGTPEQDSGNGASADQSEQLMTAAGDGSATLQGQVDANSPDNPDAGNNSGSAETPEAPSAPDANSVPAPSSDRVMSVAEAQANENAPDSDGGNADPQAGGQESMSVSTRDLPDDNRAPETPEASQTVTVRTAADREEEERPSELSADSRSATQPLRDNSPQALPETPRAQSRLSERASAADEDPVAEEE